MMDVRRGTGRAVFCGAATAGKSLTLNRSPQLEQRAARSSTSGTASVTFLLPRWVEHHAVARLGRGPQVWCGRWRSCTAPLFESQDSGSLEYNARASPLFRSI